VRQNGLPRIMMRHEVTKFDKRFSKNHDLMRLFRKRSGHFPTARIEEDDEIVYYIGAEPLQELADESEEWADKEPAKKEKTRPSESPADLDTVPRRGWEVSL